MKNAGKAKRAGLKLFGQVAGAAGAVWVIALVFELLRLGGQLRASPVLWPGAMLLCIFWILFGGLTIVFFRDPDAAPPDDTRLIISPAHGTVDVVGETVEPEFMGGPCRRVSIFLSLFDPHVQNAPVRGKVVLLKHQPGKFMCALRTESATANENVLIGFEPHQDPTRKLAVRLVAGVLARRIVPWVAPGEELACGDRISLIRFGSRVEVYLPMSAKVTVGMGQKVAGGRTVIARFE